MATAMTGEQVHVIVGGLVADMAIVQDDIKGVQAELSTLTSTVKEHEATDVLRHAEVLKIGELVTSALAEIRDGQKRTIAHWLAEVGADTVAVPVIGPTKLRTLIVLVGMSLGSLGWLGISGESVWTWWTGQEQGAHVSEVAP